MKNDKSQFVVRTSDFYLSLVIGHLPFDPRLVAKDFSSRNLGALGALRGFAVDPGLDFHREGAKHAKKTRRTLVWLRLGCTVFICGFRLCDPWRERPDQKRFRCLVGGVILKCSKASRVAIRPRGVLSRKPICMRYGS